MLVNKEFDERVTNATDDEVRGMYRHLHISFPDRQARITREMEVRGLLADEAHREREVQHMDTVERQGWWQVILGFSVLGVQLIPVGVALTVGVALGFALGNCGGGG